GANDERVRGVGHEVTEDAVACLVSVNHRKAEGLIDGLREVHAIVLVTAEEEGLVLFDWTTHFKTKLAQSDERFWGALRIRIPLIGIQGFVPQEIEAGAVIVAGAAACSDCDRSPTVSGCLRGLIVGSDLNLL